MNEAMWYNIMPNRSLKHKGTGSESQGMSLMTRVSRHESTEQGNNIFICLSFSMEELS